MKRIDLPQILVHTRLPSPCHSSPPPPYTHRITEYELQVLKKDLYKTCRACSPNRYKQYCYRNCPGNTYADENAQECMECPNNCGSCNENECLWCNKDFYLSGKHSNMHCAYTIGSGGLPWRTKYGSHLLRCPSTFYWKTWKLRELNNFVELGPFCKFKASFGSKVSKCSTMKSYFFFLFVFLMSVSIPTHSECI